MLLVVVGLGLTLFIVAKCDLSTEPTVSVSLGKSTLREEAPPTAIA
jgi:hypothetical protein